VGRETFDIRYAAHTATCTFLLDAEGICRRVVMAPHAKRKETQTASRCVGAQYVASLDASAAGCLIELPRPGTSMLFARVDERGRVSLVRTGGITKFEEEAAHDPFDSVSVKTSAPEITPRMPPPPKRKLPEDDYFDADDKTIRIQALRAEDLGRMKLGPNEDLATAEYESAPPPDPGSDVRESTPPRTIPSRMGPHHETLVAPRSEIVTEDEDNPYVAGARGMLPSSRRRDSARMRAAAVAVAPRRIK
jgi:hypothetical protein